MGGFGMIKYEVIIQDEWNNLYQIGFYNTLKEALPDVNDFLETYGVKLDEIKEYPSTFGMCFDTEIETKDENVVMVRGFILDWENIINEKSND